VSTSSEIRQQPRTLRRLLEVNRGQVGSLAGLLDGVSHVLVAARGTSDNAARYAQYVWGARNRLAVGLTTPSLFGPLEASPDLDGALVVGISQSGQSPDLVAVLTEARRQGRPTLAITNSPGSPLAEQAEHVIDIAAGPEEAVAATKTYAGELMAVALCSLAFAGEPLDGLERLPELVAASIESSGTVSEAASALADADRCVVVGRGFHLATVYEWALKLQEMAYLLAQPHSAADFLHGPVAVVEPGFPVLAVVTGGPTHGQMEGVAAAMVDRGATVVTMTDQGHAAGQHLIPIPETEPWLSPIVAAPALQLFARALTLCRGLDPESPRGLSKVTRTR